MKIKYIIIWSFVYLSCTQLKISTNSNFQQDANSYFNDIFEYHLDFVKENELALEEYIYYARPFGLLDCRPFDYDNISLNGELNPISIFPNFAYGGVAGELEFPVEIAQVIVKVFNQGSIDRMEPIIQQYKSNSREYDSLVEMVSESNINVFYGDSTVMRINDCYYYNNQFYKYVIPEGSPFSISDSLRILDCTDIFNAHKIQFKLMRKLGVIAIYSSDTFIVLIKDGMLDNSRGILYSTSKGSVNSTPLFNFAHLQEIEDNKYYFIAY